MTKAPSVFEIDLNTKEIELLKQQEVQGTMTKISTNQTNLGYL